MCGVGFDGFVVMLMVWVGIVILLCLWIDVLCSEIELYVYMYVFSWVEDLFNVDVCYVWNVLCLLFVGMVDYFLVYCEVLLCSVGYLVDVVVLIDEIVWFDLMLIVLVDGLDVRVLSVLFVLC